MGVARVRASKAVQHVARGGSQVDDRFDPDEDYSDVIGDGVTKFKLENMDPSRHYAFPEETADDISKFQSGELGVRYTVETVKEGGVFPSGMQGLLKEGDTIRVGSHVLVSCDLALWQKRQRFEARNTLAGNRAAMRKRGAGVGGDQFDQFGRPVSIGGDVRADEIQNLR